MVAIEEQDTADGPPVHVAIIMDGNGRWARARGLPRLAGHERGAEAVRRAVQACRETGIDILTLYAFSSENWKRPPAEIDDLMGLLRIYLRREIADLDSRGVRLRFIGSRNRLAPDIIGLIEESEAKTAANTGLMLVIALNYGARAEITRAAQRLAEDVAAGTLSPAAIDEEALAARMETAGIPDPDLLIRTSGEKRLSNFLLWQSAYTELVFLDICWPDFSKDYLEAAIDEYHRRDRRFGASRG